MQPLVLRNLKTADLPMEWAERLPKGRTFTVTIVAEYPGRDHAESGEPEAADSLFGIWPDNPAVRNVDDYLWKLRRGRFNAD